MNNIASLMKNLESFETTIGYSYINKENAILAFTHSSYANELKKKNVISNERLEFLGDAILNVVVSEHIYRNYSSLTEGEMTKVRATVVCEPSLMKCATEIQIGKYLLLGKGEELTGGRTRSSILSDTFESVIGSIYIDGGMEYAKKFILQWIDKLIQDAVNGLLFMDYKTQLQEKIQKNGELKITYEIVKEKGPDHNKVFVSQIRVEDEIMGVGEGKSKKEAEQNAAKAALMKIEKNRR